MFISMIGIEKQNSRYKQNAYCFSVYRSIPPTLTARQYAHLALIPYIYTRIFITELTLKTKPQRGFCLGVSSKGVSLKTQVNIQTQRSRPVGAAYGFTTHSTPLECESLDVVFAIDIELLWSARVWMSYLL